MIASLTAALSKRAAYDRTGAAIATLPLDVALDLDITPAMQTASRNRQSTASPDVALRPSPKDPGPT